MTKQNEPSAISVSDLERLMEQNRRLTGEVKRRLDQLAAINSVAALVSQSLDLDLALEASLAAVMDVINVEATGISLIDEDSQELVLVAQRGWKRDFVKMGLRMPMGHGLAWYAIQHDEIVVTGDVAQDPRIQHPAFQEEGIKAQALAPMHARGRIIGILSAMSYGPYTFNSDELTVLSAIADQIGIALDNARLFSNAINNQNKLQSILNSTADGILALDRADHVVVFNPAAETIFDRLEAHTLGKHIEQANLPAELVRGLREASQREDRGPLVFDITISRIKDKRVLSCAISPILDERHKHDGWVIVVRDVTHIRQLEALKTRVIQTAAHDLRSPLATLSGSLEMLQSLYSDPSPQQEKLLALAINSVNLMNRLITSLLSMEQIEAGLKLEDEVKVGEMLQRLIDEHRAEADRKSISLITHTPVDLPVLRGSEVWLERAVANYLSNAIKHASQGGTIQTRVWIAGNELFLEVEDDGPGIPLDAQGRLFERFYRVVRRGEDNSNGTGLGLAIVKGVIEQHNGRVYVRSQPGKGSVFGFAIPLTHEGLS